MVACDNAASVRGFSRFRVRTGGDVRAESVTLAHGRAPPAVAESARLWRNGPLPVDASLRWPPECRVMGPAGQRTAIGRRWLAARRIDHRDGADAVRRVCAVVGAPE